MTNAEIARTLERLADLLELKGENPFRLRAYRNAARVIAELTESLESLVASGADLTTIEGIGEGVAKKCVELVETGQLHQLEELQREAPLSLLDLVRVPKVGPKKAWALYQQLGVATLDQLREACQAGRVRGLPGFGEKTEQAILQGLEVAAQANQRILWADAEQAVESLRRHMLKGPPLERFEPAGSYRRGKETVGDVDILVSGGDPDAIMDHFAGYAPIDEVIGRGPTKMSVRLGVGLQIDLRVVPAESFGAALQYFTGSKQHNVILRGMARRRGLKINEYGVFRTPDEGAAAAGTSGAATNHVNEESTGANDSAAELGQRVAGRTEEEVYATLGMKVVLPELREARWEFAWAESGYEPRLIERSDIRGDLHMHTTATDGSATLVEMIEAARQRGLEYIAITDHSKRVAMARGLDGERLAEQWAEITALQTRYPDIRVLKGVECDILENGEMDLPDEVLAGADWVMASIHYGQNQSRQQITDRIIRAIRHPFVSAISHPTGRLLNRRKPYDVDLGAVLEAAREHRKLLELNSNPYRLDLDDSQVAMAREKGVLVVINTDAHATGELDALRYGIVQARRGGLEPQHVGNTRTWDELRQLVGTGR